MCQCRKAEIFYIFCRIVADGWRGCYKELHKSSVMDAQAEAGGAAGAKIAIVWPLFLSEGEGADRRARGRRNSAPFEFHCSQPVIIAEARQATRSLLSRRERRNEVEPDGLTELAGPSPKPCWRC